MATAVTDERYLYPNHLPASLLCKTHYMNYDVRGTKSLKMRAFEQFSHLVPKMV